MSSGQGGVPARLRNELTPVPPQRGGRSDPTGAQEQLYDRVLTADPGPMRKFTSAPRLTDSVAAALTTLRVGMQFQPSKCEQA
jgi:hypothetical protein